jgi:DNA polymerase III, delta subunit
MIIGHVRQQEQLARLRDVPVVLLAGPASVGKMTLAAGYARVHAAWPDCLVIPELTSDDARAVQEFVVSAPVVSLLRYVVIDLDGSSEQSRNQLLKVLEEPPETARFLLTASHGQHVPATVASRSFTLQFGLLSADEVRQVLELRGVDPDVARRDAPLGAGQVAPALAGMPSPSLARVSAVLHALERRDAGALNTALKDWDGVAHELLGLWAAEAAVPRWTRFSSGLAPGLSPADARRVLAGLCSYPLARPALAASSALMPLCR